MIADIGGQWLTVSQTQIPSGLHLKRNQRRSEYKSNMPDISSSKCISLYLTTKGLFLPQTSSWKTLFHVFLSLKTFRQIILLFARMKYDENHRNFKYLKCLIYVLYLLLPVSTMYKVPQPSLSSAGGKKYNSLIV